MTADTPAPPAAGGRATVSVVPIAKDGGALIAAARESVDQATIPPSGMLVADDGFTNRTVAIAVSFPRIGILRQASSSGA